MIARFQPTCGGYAGISSVGGKVIRPLCRFPRGTGLQPQVTLEYGVFRTAKVLRLEYGRLKRRMESASPSPKLTGVPRLGPATFWELLPPQGVPSELGLSECLIELEGARGKMRIQWKGATALDLADLSRGWWESR